MAAILANYHTHTPRCLHAKGSEEEYVKAAIDCGYSVLGFSDHTPWPFQSGYVSHCRMAVPQLEEYVSTVNALRQKYAEKITIHLGLEAEYFPDYLPWLQSQVNHFGIEYLIFGNHFCFSEESGEYFGAAHTPEQAERYTDYAVKGMESGLYCCLAHPDLCLNQYPHWDATLERCMHRICAAAVRTHTPLEYNVLGETRRLADAGSSGLGYTHPHFWQIAAQYPVDVIVGCDAHEIEMLDKVPHIREIQRHLRAQGMHVLDTLPDLV